MLLQGILAGCEAFIERRDENTRFEEHDAGFTQASQTPFSYSPPTMMCYLECEEGKEFRIQLKRNMHPRPKKDFSVQVFIDGRRIRVSAWSKIRDTAVYDYMTQKRENGYVDVNLAFHKLSLVEDAVGVAHAKDLEELGTIRLDFYPGIQGQSRRWDGEPRNVTTDVGPISEKMKKGLIGQTIVGGKSRPHVEQGTVDFIYDDPTDTRPGFRVVFKYRSRQLLIARDIIPRPDLAASPQPQSASEEEKSDDEVIVVSSSRKRRKLRSTVRDQAQGGNVGGSSTDANWEAKYRRLEAEVATLRDSKIVKTEPAQIPRAIKTSGVIDLTLDDD